MGDYWNPAPLGGATVAWTGRNLVHSPVGIFCAEWNNPFPEKTISSIDVIGNLTATQFVVVAISGGIIKNKGQGATTVSDWHLSEFADGEVRNHTPGGGPLKAGTPSPTLEGTNGLKFENGQALTGETKAIPGLAGFGTQPFAVRMTFCPLAKPTSPCGGLFEVCGYGTNGFRLTLGGSMKLAIEVWPGPGFSSKTVFEIGRTYTVEMRFDGTYATLLVDGQTDTMKEMAMPAPYDGPIRIGVAAGKDYFYNGTISQISISKLPADH